MASLLTVSQVKNPVPGRYIVILKDSVSLAAHVSSIQANLASTTSKITHEFKFINAYAGEFTDGDLNDLRANPDIASIEQDSVGWLCHSIVQSVLPPAYRSKLTDFSVRFPTGETPLGSRQDLICGEVDRRPR